MQHWTGWPSTITDELHSTLDYLIPMQYEERLHAAQRKKSA